MFQRYYKFVLTSALALSVIQTTQASEMRVFEGYASSRAVLSGDYGRAIRIAEQRVDARVALHRVVNATALCVAYTKTDQLDRASTMCERASAEVETVPKNMARVSGYGDPAVLVKVVTDNRATLEQVTKSVEATN